MADSAANFVHIIEQYSCLYNNKLPEYSRKDVTDRAWSEVAQKTNTSVANCQSRWRNIRNGFVRSLTSSGSSTKQKKLYYLHEELQFVLPFMKAIIHTGEPGNIPLLSEVDTENIESNSSTDEVPCASSSTNTLETPSSGSVESNTFKKPKIRKVTNEADKAFVEWIKKKESKTDSARKMFLLSLLPDVENLSEEQMRKFRIKVLLLLEEIQSDQSLQPKVPPQYGNTYAPIQQTQQYRDNYSPISSVDSPSNYSASTSISEHLSQLDHFESL
ncbi:hypothetical protein FQR65_LT15449 [Abscondita terminalis]|nr:hypothetical protein FQR65_LT15449 [Abscondita terminalis]